MTDYTQLQISGTCLQFLGYLLHVGPHDAFLSNAPITSQICLDVETDHLFCFIWFDLKFALG